MAVFWGYTSGSTPVNRVLLVQVDGQLTDESLRELYLLSGIGATATDPSTAIVDFSSVTEFAVSSHVFRELARQQPLMQEREQNTFHCRPADSRLWFDAHPHDPTLPMLTTPTAIMDGRLMLRHRVKIS